ncbi:ATP-binding protein [Pontibacter chinhatensis]|uniref:histidine kinase n=1 Tax=Pontibacter chinhatensis TaxID=1436961 RepID=A0A1I2U8W9_9BACT|nr:ATP-binding protein [Pontibacter chinhatensis]SFG71041.1 Signal transduction histidine kinase [Pontibacter chinhatensis]
MKIFGDSIKTKVVVGFTLALSIVAAAIYLTYTSFTKLLDSVEVLSQPNNKLMELQKTLSTIATAESAIRAFTLTAEEKHFRAYLGHLDTIQSQIDTLEMLMKDSPRELAQVDSISALLQQKHKSLDQYVALKKQQKEHTYSSKAMRQIASTAEQKPLSTTIRKNTTTTISDRLNLTIIEPEEPQQEPQQQEEEKEDKRGFLGKIFTKKEKPAAEPVPVPKVIMPQLQVKQEVEIDTTITDVSVAPLNQVRRILYNVQREADEQARKLQDRELALLQQDKQVMDQIRLMMHELERHEHEKAQLNSATAREVAQQTSTILLAIGLLGLGSGIAFILIILRDLTRSNNYKSRLIQAQKEAVKLARAKEAFVANMSHEMRTPLNVVLGFTQQLRHTPLRPDQADHLEAIDGAGQHLLHIVNDVLDLSKMEAGKLQINRTPFALRQLLTQVEQAFALKASSKDISLSFRVEATIPDNLNADALRLKQVLFNLVDNAIKFTHQGQVTVDVRLRSQRRSRLALSIAVSDTGIGIPQERLQHVFGEFNQADDSILRKYGGTGLGLSISKKLVDIQGGTLTVSSVPDEGTTFTIVLPMQVSREEATAVPADAVPVPCGFKGYKALVVDDDAYSRTLCNLILSRWGMQVHLANDGREALELVRQHSFDIVLTDIQLPGMSGKTVARNIRKLDKQVPIIALTANILSNDAGFFDNTAITGHVLKPFTEQELHQKIVQALPSESLAAEPEQSISTALPEQPAAAAKPEEELYDLSEMRLFTGDDHQALAAVLEVLVQDQEQNLEQLVEAASAKDWEAAGNMAHKMITAFRHLKADTVTPHLAQLEQVLHTGHQEDLKLQQAVEEVQPQVRQVLRALQQELQSIHAMAEAS